LAASDFHHPALIGSLVAGRAVDHRRSRSESGTASVREKLSTLRFSSNVGSGQTAASLSARMRSRAAMTTRACAR
jgi:hypothetical protein